MSEIPQVETEEQARAVVTCIAQGNLFYLWATNDFIENQWQNLTPAQQTYIRAICGKEKP